MVTATIVDGDKCESSPGEPQTEGKSSLVSSEEFQYRNFVYHSLLRELETRIRRKSKDTYLAAVADIISDVVLARLSKSTTRETAAEPSLTTADYGILRERLISLCRFYPYDPIGIRPAMDGLIKGRTEKNKVGRVDLREMRVAGVAQQVQFALHEGSPFYDRVRMHHLLEPDIVRRRLEDMINARFGAWTAYGKLRN